MNLVNKVARRKKRQDKLFNKKLVSRTIKKLFGDETREITYHPSQDPSKSNHRRVVEQRVRSGRLDMDNYRKVKH